MVSSQQIIIARKKVRESQEAFASRFGVDQSTVHRWETGGVPDRGTTLMAVERVLSEIEALEPANDEARQ
jgi:DNA-binding transcriptional regulator YiaG